MSGRSRLELILDSQHSLAHINEEPPIKLKGTSDPFNEHNSIGTIGIIEPTNSIDFSAKNIPLQTNTNLGPHLDKSESIETTEASNSIDPKERHIPVQKP